eukprot:s3111_g4.t1
MGDQSAPALSDLWEGEASLRARARTNGSLLVWANPRVVGVASTGAMALNIRCLEILAEWWASQTELPQAVPIQVVRGEVIVWRTLCGLPADQGVVAADSWGLKRLFSYGIRRWLTGAKAPRIVASTLAKDVTLQGLWNVFDSYWAGMAGDNDPNHRAAPLHPAGAPAEGAGGDPEPARADLGAALSAAMPSLEPSGVDHSPLISPAASPIALDDIEDLEGDDGERSLSEDHGGNVLCESLSSKDAPMDALTHANPVMDPVAPEPAASVACRSSSSPGPANVDRRVEIQAKLEHVRWDIVGRAAPPAIP